MPGHVRNRGKRQDGTAKWQARWRHPDDPSIRLERVFRNKAVAERWITKMEADAHAGMFRDDRAADRSFSEVVDVWRETRAPGMAASSRARYEQILRTHLLPEFGRKKVSSLSREVVKRYFARLEAGGMGPGTLRKVHTTLSAVLSEAVELDILKTNPCARALRGRARVDQREMLFLSAEEVALVAEAITPHFRVLVYTAAYTGLRASELGGLRVRDLDLGRGVLHVRQSLKLAEGRDMPAKGASFGDLKSRSSRRTVPLPGQLRALLAEHLAGLPGGARPDALVFTSESGTPLRHNLFYRRHFRPAVKAALPADKHALRFHDLRHTYAALLIRADKHPKLVSQLMGHSSIAITMDRYGHLYDDVHDATADALDALWTGGAADAPRLRVVK